MSGRAFLEKTIVVLIVISGLFSTAGMYFSLDIPYSGKIRKVKFSKMSVQMYGVKIFGGIIFGRSGTSE